MGLRRNAEVAMEPRDSENVGSPFGAGLSEPHSPTPAPRPAQEVEAVPITRSEVRGPSVEAHAERTVPPPPQAPPPAPEPPPAPKASATAHAASAPSSDVPPPPIPPAGAANAAPAAATPLQSTDPRAPGRFWVVLCHLAFLIPGHLPGLALTTLIWIARRGSDPRVEDQGREAINMQLNFFAVNALLLLMFNCVTAAFTPLVWAVGAVMCVVAAVKSGDESRYRYPWIFRVIV